ncbi:class F sortase [Candidatus Saccharibacteria bacterium]|nr:class F sortase [Candidatus Saccharibacteria bacterium]
MSLKIDFSPKRIVKWVVWGILGVLLLAFLIRVAVWEDAYYREKEGSERDEAVTVVGPEDEEIVEIPPTEEEVVEYTVGPKRPRYLTVEKLGVYYARILPMGVNSKGELNTPNNIFDVGWYEASYAPGEGGTMVLDGHNGGPRVHGVFKDLPSLAAGDIIQVERGDGVKYRYSVVENVTVPLVEADNYMSKAMRSPEPGKESVTLISCTGEWSQTQKTYLSRQFTRAVLITE